MELRSILLVSVFALVLSSCDDVGTEPSPLPLPPKGPDIQVVAPPNKCRASVCGLDDFSVTVNYTFKNFGDAIGNATATLWVEQPPGSIIASIDSLIALAPGTAMQIEHEFCEPVLGPQYECGASVNR
jgi:hypothetical protein